VQDVIVTGVDFTGALYVKKSRHMCAYLPVPLVEQFILKNAPWFGGFWERLIGLTKAAIKKILGRAHVSLQALQTIVANIEQLPTYLHFR